MGTELVNKLFGESLLGQQLGSYSSRLGSLIRLHFGGNNGKRQILTGLRLVLDRLSPGRSTADCKGM